MWDNILQPLFLCWTSKGLCKIWQQGGKEQFYVRWMEVHAQNHLAWTDWNCSNTWNHLRSFPLWKDIQCRKFLRLPAVRLIEVENPAMVIIPPRIVDLLIEWNCNHQLRYPADTALASVEHVPSVTYRLFRLPGETSSGKPKNFQVWEELWSLSPLAEFHIYIYIYIWTCVTCVYFIDIDISSYGACVLYIYILYA